MQSDWEWLQDVIQVEGKKIFTSPDGGKTIRSHLASDHPIFILTRGQLPFDTWYKIYGNGYE